MHIEEKNKCNICVFKYFTNNVPFLCYFPEHFLNVPFLAKQTKKQKIPPKKKNKKRRECWPTYKKKKFTLCCHRCLTFIVCLFSWARQ